MSSPARKRLPVNPSLEHLKKQAKRFAAQRALSLAKAQHQLALDYGAKSWSELSRIVHTMSRGSDVLSNNNAPMQPLPAAANKNDLAAVQQILGTGQFTQHDLDLTLARCILSFNQRRAIAELLIEHGADPDGQYGSNYGPIVFVTGECLDPDGLEFLINHGADVTVPPIPTKYGPQCPLSYFLGTYIRGQNDKKHRGIEILLQHKAHIPAEVAPELLAIHRGNASELAQLVAQNPALLTKHYPAMPYGNILLAGATLLHAAVEFGENDCIDTLLDRGADVNARAFPIEYQNSNIENSIGQSPVFHAIASINAALLPTLEHLLAHAGSGLNLSLRATFRHSDDNRIQAIPVTPLEYARQNAGPEIPAYRRTTEKELTLLDSATDLRRQVSAG